MDQGKLMQSLRVKKCMHSGYSETGADVLPRCQPFASYCISHLFLHFFLLSLPVSSFELLEVNADRGAAQQLQGADFQRSAVHMGAPARHEPK